ncbi:hypothetical protein D3870_00290 [Noviherbaspirillum cavernae]|uniref:Glutamine--fructose-6-phosphate aminotransferase [isomerizing] n=1 Tax=Noviherbaspirillum cavernae TaxID=2320862 RepID=A0A418WX50_9BURK|nr:hypothetical protein [Noviherbaspirillum cavernae]RJG04665.1 hypothetical protein D3870_00290 [Noviherbaspirillum cavernae]
MCGIFGVLAGKGAAIGGDALQAILGQLYELSESRGKESAGIHAYLPQRRHAWTLKGDVPATDLIKTSQYQTVIRAVLSEAFPAGQQHVETPVAMLAHSRLVTNGAAERYENNQPVRSGGVTMIHNGIVVNVDDLWRGNPHLLQSAEVDTEVIAAIVNDALSQGGDAVQATCIAYRKLKGAASIAWVHDAFSQVVLATNTGDLYFFHDESRSLIVFASERYILEQAMQRCVVSSEPYTIAWLGAGNGMVFDLTGGKVQRFDLGGTHVPRTSICEQSELATHHQDSAVTGNAAVVVAVSDADESLLRYDEAAIRSIRRCTCCVLPETFPFIEFDQKGVCNYCRSYKTKYKGVDPTAVKRQFIESIQKYKAKGGTPDVLVPFSGGRDSCYGLHLIQREFGLNPITFTYDWGMVTDLARRNIARICGQLGVQNILVSADIKTKRENIRKNVSAWLRQPDLGMVPLFMAGDKQFFKIVNQLKRQTGIRLNLWSGNPLENTDFKSGFCGVKPDFGKDRLDFLSLDRKIRLAGYYGIRFLANPSYINSSLLDTANAFSSYYLEPREDLFLLFNHLVWDENEVNETLINTYNFELAADTPSTWRIGDGTAPFYNYIYMTARGFTEFDTFRSNQIREGMMKRDEALEFVLKENYPRVESLRWYLSTIGLDFNATIKAINALDTLGLHS